MRFSVVIPVYNVASYLRASLDSLVEQTLTDWEAICVDDGSTDGGDAILDGYAVRDGRFVVMHQSNQGVSAARNAGLAAARGEWIVFLDPDDILHPQVLATYDRMIRTYPDTDGATIRPVHFPDGKSPDWPASDDSLFASVDLTREVPFEVFDTPVWACAYRRERLGDLCFRLLTVGEDQLFVLGFLERAAKVVQSDFAGYAYRFRRDSAYHARRTAKKFREDVVHLRSVAEILAASPKRYAQAAWRKTALQLTGYLAADFARLTAADRALAWSEWMEALREVGRMNKMPWLSRVAMRIVGMTESRLLVRLLRIVQWLKLHGLNRRLVVHREVVDS